MEIVLNGSLRFFSLPEVLNFLSATRKSATLTLTNAGRTSSIYFQNGAVVFASSDQEQFAPGLLLLRKKKITKPQRDALDALVAREGDLYPAAAARENVFTPDTLLDIVRVQTSEVLFEALRWEGGEFRLVDSGAQPTLPVPLNLDLAALLAEGAMHAEEWNRCLTLLPNKEALFRVVPDPEAQGKITLSLDQWRVLFKLDGNRSLEQIVREAEEEPIEVYRIVYELLSNGLIREVDEDTSTATTKDAPLPQSAAGEAEPFVPSSQVTPRVDIETPPPPPAWEPPPPPPAAGMFAGPPLQLDVPPSDSQGEATIADPDSAKFSIACLMVDGTERTAFPLVDREYVIGREAGNSIQIPDSSVSATHARLTFEHGSYVIEDLKSRNGTYVNGERIDRQVLHENDKVRLGKVLLTFTNATDLKQFAAVVPPRA